MRKRSRKQENLQRDSRRYLAKMEAEAKGLYEILNQGRIQRSSYAAGGDP
jgi:hypothetical protein